MTKVYDRKRMHDALDRVLDARDSGRAKDDMYHPQFKVGQSVSVIVPNHEKKVNEWVPGVVSFVNRDLSGHQWWLYLVKYRNSKGRLVEGKFQEGELK
jgi:hypothetical protein